VKCKNPQQRFLNKMRRRRCACGFPLRAWDMSREEVEKIHFGGTTEYIGGSWRVTCECINGHVWSESYPEDAAA